MNISTELAQMIVSDMKEIINKEINYIDTDGVIIASTDKTRIGAFHAGGKKVLKNSSELVIQYDGELVGARKGINMPIYFEKDIVGVIGITGESSEVRKYGKIIKTMTEILIKEEYVKNVRNIEKENQRIIIEDILFHDSLDKGNAMSDMNIFNIKENVDRFVCIAELFGHSFQMVEDKNDIYDLFHKVFSNQQALIMQNRNKLIIILKAMSKRVMNSLFEKIRKEMATKYHLQVRFGVGTQENEVNELKNSYKYAQLALEQALLSETDFCIYYADLDIELILNHISEPIATDYCDRVIGSLDEKEINQYLQIIQLFEIYNGSITKVSEALYIHKNTLQYRLNRLVTKTGYDMRKYQDFVVLKIAFSLNLTKKQKNIVMYNK